MGKIQSFLMLNLEVLKVTTILKRFGIVTNKLQNFKTNLRYVILIKAKKHATKLLKLIFNIPSAVNMRKNVLYDLMSCIFVEKYRKF